MPHRHRSRRRINALAGALFSLALLLTLASASQPDAHAAAPAPLQISATADGLRIVWRGSVARAASGAAQIPGWPLVELGGAQMPAQLVAVVVREGAVLRPRVERLTSHAWQGALAQATAVTPRTPSGTERPALGLAQRAAMPAAPVTVLRAGRLRGQQLAVLAVSPLFVAGTLQAADDFAVTIPGAALLQADAATLLASAAPFVSDAPGPTNPAATGASWTLRVTAAGIQRIGGAALAAAGVDLRDPARLHLRRGGVEVALEERRSASGLDELRFYAPVPGDRWNSADTYWLTLEATSGLRMTQRSVTPGGAPARSTALDRGVWRRHSVYDTLLPGPDGDHWFAGDMRTAPGLPPATLSAPLTPTLPLVAGTTTLTITGSAYTAGAHQLTVTLGGASEAATWSGTADWTKVFSLADSAATVTLALTPGAAPDGIEPDSIAWERPVALDFGGRGAQFVGAAGVWRYQLANTAADRALYDVTDPQQPALLALPSGEASFEDGTDQRVYLLTGPGTLHTPAFSAHASGDLAAPPGASALYIAPVALHAALAPLVERRHAQGYSVRVVDVQAIYDAWSYGQVAPAAIRAFVRYAASGSPAPAAVILVGDGTNDPFDDTRKGTKNVNLIPPYLAMVDPYIGETACETCYAQLDGDDPLADALPDLAIGRLPIKSADELTALVAKIIGYETLQGGLAWRSRSVYVADNYRDADGTRDTAGDFAALADQSVAQQPPGVAVQRIYYDPWRKDEADRPLNDAWREPDAAIARQKTRAAWNDGAGFINYVGHSQQWQWAFTAPSEEPFLLYLNDADQLTNAGRLPILLEMTCLTSAFHLPAFSGTTIDERLLLAAGGAAAVWGATGEGVAHGHDALQRGFYGALWSRGTRRMGELTTAGYLELFTNGRCCQDALRTFALLGDPLTPVQAQLAQRTYLPLTGRR